MHEVAGSLSELLPDILIMFLFGGPVLHDSKRVKKAICRICVKLFFFRYLSLSPKLLVS